MEDPSRPLAGPGTRLEDADARILRGLQNTQRGGPWDGPELLRFLLGKDRDRTLPLSVVTLYVGLVRGVVYLKREVSFPNRVNPLLTKSRTWGEIGQSGFPSPFRLVVDTSPCPGVLTLNQCLTPCQGRGGRRVVWVSRRRHTVPKVVSPGVLRLRETPPPKSVRVPVGPFTFVYTSETTGVDVV